MSASTGTAPLPGAPSSRVPWLRPKYALFAAIGAMFLVVLFVFESFLLKPTDPEWRHIAPWKYWLLIHALAGGCAIILGPLQFSDRLRQRYTKMHRVVGRIYVATALIAAPLGTYIEYLQERTGATRSFTIETVLQGSLWFLTTLIAFVFILKGNVQAHRTWMTRSFGTGPLIFLEARVIFWLIGLEHLTPGTVETVVWLCTASSIFVADVVLQIQESLRKRAAHAKQPIPAATNLARA